MGVNLANKTVNTNNILCDGTVDVTLSLTASPDIITNPTDIVLVLDRSGSMTGEALTNMKKGADAFVDIIAEATGGASSGEIGSGSRIGVVSFADTATQDTSLITSVEDIKSAINDLTANGSTNHADAFKKAVSLLDSLENGNARVMVMFTDGKTTSGSDPNPIAQAAKLDGIIIYCIGLIGEDGIDPQVLDEWATPPSDSHVLIAPDDEDLEELFKTLAENISKTGATDIVIDEVINSDFTITEVKLPDMGTVVKESDTRLKWSIPELGVTANQSAVLRFTIKHIANSGGDKKVNKSITYTDNEQNVVVFPDPMVSVDCGVIVYPEECPEPISIPAEGCNDTVYYDLKDIYMESMGRILQLDMTLKNICPKKRVALCVTLNERDEEGNEEKRGIKMFTIPAHYYDTCRDVEIRCIRFILPEDLSPQGRDTMCGRRTFIARVMANYIDYDFEYCQDIEITI